MGRGRRASRHLSRSETVAVHGQRPAARSPAAVAGSRPGSEPPPGAEPAWREPRTGTEPRSRLPFVCGARAGSARPGAGLPPARRRCRAPRRGQRGGSGGPEPRRAPGSAGGWRRGPPGAGQSPVGRAPGPGPQPQPRADNIACAGQEEPSSAAGKQRGVNGFREIDADRPA